MSGAVRPPKRWTALLRLLPGRPRRQLVDELESLYEYRIARDGRAPADSWYRKEVLALLLTLPADALRRGLTGCGRLIFNGLASGLQRDVIRALRSYRRSPGPAALAVATLAVGIGAATLTFSVVDQVVVRPLPYAEADRLVAVWPASGMLRGELAVLQADATTLDGIAGYVEIDGLNLERPDGSRRLSATLVSPELLPTLGVDPALGRGFTAEEALAGTGNVVLLSWGLWSDEFGADADIVGARVVLDGAPHTVVGVLPAGFGFPSASDVLVPLIMNPQDAGVFWGWGGHRAIARLADGATTAAAQDEARRLSGRMRELNVLWTPPADFRAETVVIPLRDAMVGDVTSTLWMLMGAVGLVLMVACANVANLLLARGLVRGRELAIRSALGASRTRIAIEQLVEALLLAAIGCGAALLTAGAGLRLLVAYLPPDVPRATEVAMDGRVAVAGVLSALLAGGIAGLVPALRGAGVAPCMALRSGGGRGVTGGSPGWRRLSGAVVVGQIAIAVVLVIGAGLLLRTLGELSSVDVGFRADNVTTGRLTMSASANETEMLGLYDGVVERLSALPGVDAAAIASHVPFGPGDGSIATFIEGVTEDPNSLPVMVRSAVTADYLNAMKIPLLQGRGLLSTDTAASGLVAVVNEAMADSVWPGESPLGRRIRYPWQGAPWIEVVGVTGNVADSDLAAAPQPGFLVPISQAPFGQVSIVMRSDLPLAAAADAVRDVVGDLAPQVPVSAIAPMTRLVWGSMASPRWIATILSLFASAALILGCVGIYGVMAYSVRERTAEFGVRMALGAEAGRIRRLVFRDGMLLALPGAAIGLLLAIGATRLLSGVLYGVSTVDPLTFVTVPLLLTAAAVVASYVPARRATRVDPVSSMRRQG